MLKRINRQAGAGSLWGGQRFRLPTVALLWAVSAAVAFGEPQPAPAGTNPQTVSAPSAAAPPPVSANPPAAPQPAPLPDDANEGLPKPDCLYNIAHRKTFWISVPEYGWLYDSVSVDPLRRVPPARPPLLRGKNEENGASFFLFKFFDPGDYYFSFFYQNFEPRPAGEAPADDGKSLSSCRLWVRVIRDEAAAFPKRKPAASAAPASSQTVSAGVNPPAAPHPAPAGTNPPAAPQPVPQTPAAAALQPAPPLSTEAAAAPASPQTAAQPASQTASAAPAGTNPAPATPPVSANPLAALQPALSTASAAPQTVAVNSPPALSAAAAPAASAASVTDHPLFPTADQIPFLLQNQNRYLTQWMPKGDRALFQLGLYFYSLNRSDDMKQAADCFKAVARLYPAGAWTEEALQRSHAIDNYYFLIR